jgi:hypothetical protein
MSFYFTQSYPCVLIGMDTTIPALLTLEQTSKLFNMPIPLIRALIRQGKLTIAPNIKRNYRISVASIEKYVQESATNLHFAALRNKGATNETNTKS